jgi:nucleoside-diphosphate-sugar epimerase
VKILITGGSGFIGSHIVEHYQGLAEEIRVLDNLRTGYRKNLDGLQHVFIESSVTDREAVAKAVEGVETKIDTGAQPHLAIGTRTDILRASTQHCCSCGPSRGQ